MLSPQDGFTPLYVASQNGHSQVAELLLGKGADVNPPHQVQYVSKCNTCYRYPIISKSTSYYCQGY